MTDFGHLAVSFQSQARWPVHLDLPSLVRRADGHSFPVQEKLLPQVDRGTRLPARRPKHHQDLAFLLTTSPFFTRIVLTAALLMLDHLTVALDLEQSMANDSAVEAGEQNLKKKRLPEPARHAVPARTGRFRRVRRRDRATPANQS